MTRSEPLAATLFVFFVFFCEYWIIIILSLPVEDLTIILFCDLFIYVSLVSAEVTQLEGRSGPVRQCYIAEQQV